jgi:hypothetical protein
MRSPATATWKPLVSVPFLICVVLLGGAALMAGPLARQWKQFFIKDAIHLRKPLHELRRSGLGPYQFVQDDQLSASVVAALGTEMYVSRLLKDTRQPDDSPLHRVSLSVTYYTGGTNLVPHTPDVCMEGAGYTKKDAGYDTLTVESLGPDDMEVPIRWLIFEKSEVFRRAEPKVAYTFHCNGAFTASRTGVRQRTTKLTDRYAYFSKVEVSFSGAGGETPTREQAVQATRDFFEYLLPVLLQEHWPDWEAATRPEATASQGPVANDGAALRE